jgi:prepilin-type N-terminal cleavage/methylation domain-containing protein
MLLILIKKSKSFFSFGGFAMKVFRRHSGFSMIEVLTAIAIIAVLASMVLGLGKRIKAQGRENFCKSEIDIIDLALKEYYDQHTGFPFVSELDPVLAPIYIQAVLLTDLDAEFGISGSIVTLEDYYASSEMLFYYLDQKCLNSRKLIEKLATSLKAVKTASGIRREYLDGTTPVLDLVRFVDPWGNSLRYTYSAGDAFPIITSAGADGNFGTGDDIKN